MPLLWVVLGQDFEELLRVLCERIELVLLTGVKLVLQVPQNTRLKFLDGDQVALDELLNGLSYLLLKQLPNEQGVHIDLTGR